MLSVRTVDTDTDTDTDTWFIVKATDPYTRLELGGGRWGRERERERERERD